MNPGRWATWRKRNSALISVIVAAIVIGFLLFIGLISLAPDAVAFSPNNYGWNGIQTIYSQYSIRPVNSLGDVSDTLNNKSVLLVLSPVESFTATDARAATNFVKEGGTLVIADSDGSSNSLLNLMNLPIQIESSFTIYDPFYNWKAPSLPVAVVLPSAVQAFGSLLGRVGDIALNGPSPLLVSGSNVKIIATTSALSFEANRNTTSSVSIPFIQSSNPTPIAKGPFDVAAAEVLGKGAVLVIGGPGSFMNSIIGVGGNPVLASNLFSNATVYLDTSHWQIDTSAFLKAEFLSLYSTMVQFPLRYLLTLGIVGVAIAIWPVSSALKETKNREAKRANGEVESDTYEPRILEKIRKDREKWRATN